MSVIHISGKIKNVSLDMTPSTALVRDTIVEFTSGLIAGADDNDTLLAGVIQHDIASGDDNYADTRKEVIAVPMEPNVIWEIDTDDTLVAATHQGNEYGIVDSGKIDVDDTTNKVFLITEVVSANKARGYLKINGSY